MSEALSRLTVARESAAGRHVLLEPQGNGVRIELHDGRGRPLAERTLPASPDCAATTQAVAVVVATWLATLPAVTPATPQLTAPAPPEVPAVRPRWAAELSAAVAGTWVSAPGTSLGGELVLGAGAGNPHGLGVSLELSASTPRSAPLGPGRVWWQRFGLAAAARYRLAAGPLAIDLLGRALAAALYSRGEGFTSDSSAWGPDWGAGLGVRAALALGAVCPWLGLDAAWWLRRQEVGVTGFDGRVVLPSVAVGLVAGVRWTAL